MIIITIDPGLKGAYAWNDGDLLFVDKFNDRSWEDIPGFTSKAYIEKVHAMGDDGRSSSFKFGQNYGQWIGWLQVLEIPFEEVSPQAWMKHVSGLPKFNKIHGESKESEKRRRAKLKTERKNEIKRQAQNLHPEIKVTLQLADAIMMHHVITRYFE